MLVKHYEYIGDIEKTLGILIKMSVPGGNIAILLKTVKWLYVSRDYLRPMANVCYKYAKRTPYPDLLIFSLSIS